MRLKIGEFANLGHVSVRMLRHYDKLNLLKPIHKDEESGFRYYAVDQLMDLHLIRDLQSLGFTLKDIEALRETTSIDRLHQQLWQRQRQLQSEIEERARQITEIQYRLKLIEGQNARPSRSFTIKTLAPQTIIQARAMLQSEDDIFNGFQCLMSYMRTHHITVKKSIGIKHYAVQENGDFEWALQLSDMNFQRLSVDNRWQLTRRKLDGAVVASALIRGSFAQSLPSQNGFHAWADVHHYELVGAVREIYLRLVNDDIHHPDNLMEVQFPIRQMH